MKIKIFSLLVVFSLASCLAQENFTKSNYEKNEFMIPMRDGIKLFTSVYSPKDQSEQYPIIMIRTPYSCNPYGEQNFTNIPKHLAEEKFIFVFQDVRGKFMSEGEFVNMRPYLPAKKGNEIDESSDTYDSIDWLIKNIPNNNRKVGIYGISYPGFYAAMSLNDSHPALKAVSPQAPIADWFVDDDMHHNGALTLLLSYNFFSGFGKPRPQPTSKWTGGNKYDSPDAYTFFLNVGPIKNLNEKYLKNEISFWNEMSEHPNYDEFWKSRNTLYHFNKVKPAVMTVGGWYDAEDLYGALQTYQTIEKKNPGIFNVLVMGPWQHGGWSRSNGETFGDMNFGSNSSEYFKNNLELPFFRYFLKGKGNLDIAEATIFEVGNNQWHQLDSWPIKNTDSLSLFLSDNQKLDFSQPTISGEYEYISDPSGPVPYTSKILDSRNLYFRPFMNEDQRFTYSRPDVISVNTDDLKNDLSIAGEIEAEIYVSTTSTDADWIIKLIDVFPDSAQSNSEIEWGGYQLLVRADILRGKYRNSLESPEAFIPNQPTKIKLKLNDIFHTFKKGHKIMVQIQSSWFPLFDRNPQTFCDIYKADKKDFTKATHNIFYGGRYNSRLKLNYINSVKN